MGSTLSLVASVAILRNTINDVVPEELRGYLYKIFRRFSTELTVVIKESHEGSTNHLFHSAGTYLDGHTLSISDLPQRFTVGKNENMRKLTFGLEKNSEIVDEFEGVILKWRFNSDYNSKQQFETRWYEVSFHRTHAEMVKNRYLPYVIEMAKKLKDQNKIVKFYTVRHDRWSSNAINLDHPMTFDTLVLDGDLKKTVLKDLESFREGKEYYKKIGKVWKRGYLLYGPPGTGKSSLVAAMSNYLNFDIYNLNLSAVNSDSSLEYLLLHVPHRSILVVEDIDCSVKLQNRQLDDVDSDPPPYRRPQVTLSGLLNAIDGLLSCCGDERITIFTTNYREKIDPALLRAGRMDMHISLSYCTFSTFKQLAANYLGISDHHLFCRIEKLLEKVNISPAEVAGQLMNAKRAKTPIDDFVKFLESKESEEQQSAAAPPDLPTPDAEESKAQNCNKKKKIKSKSAAKKSDLPNDESAVSENDAKLPNKPGSDTVKVGEYTIKGDLAPTLQNILSKHGDIVAGSLFNTVQCRSSLLEIVCAIIQKLQTTKLKDLTEIELRSIMSQVEDLESVNMDVSWLRRKLEGIAEAMRLVDLVTVI